MPDGRGREEARYVHLGFWSDVLYGELPAAASSGENLIATEGWPL